MLCYGKKGEKVVGDDNFHPRIIRTSRSQNPKALRNCYNYFGLWIKIDKEEYIES